MSLFDTITNPGNIFPGGLFGSPSGSSPGPRLIPQGQAQGYIGTAANLAQQPLDQGSMDYLRQLIMNPNFGPQNQNQQNLVSNLYAGRQAQFNNLGIGDSPAAQSSIAASAAPSLLGFNQNTISNLAQFLQLLQQQRTATTGTLSDLAKFGQPQGNVSVGVQPGAFQLLFGNDGLLGSGSSGSALAGAKTLV